MQDNLRGKSGSHFLIALINPASSEGERTDETVRFTFLLPTDSPSFFRPHDHHHWGVSYRAVYPKLCMFSHPLLVRNIVGGFCMSASFMFNNRFVVCFLWLLVVLSMCCLFYVQETQNIGVLSGCWFGSMHVCRILVCCCVLGFWFPCFLPLRTPMASL